MEQQDPRLKEIWRQKYIPVIFRRQSPKPLLVKLPYAQDNFNWLRDDRRHKPKWNPKFKSWETPISWFDNNIKLILKRYKKVYIIQLYKVQQKCAPACWKAEGFHCECSCMGENHGTGHPGGKWHEVSDTFAFEWGEKKYACRLMEANN